MWPGRPLSQEGTFELRQRENKKPRSGIRAQAMRRLAAKTLKPNEFAISEEQQEGQCGWSTVSMGKKDVLIKSELQMGAGARLKSGQKLDT